ncbi:AAA family ATPase [Rhizobium glycinendophyticum]|uniref:AAA family ATPase n=1 Tax=Rhizobium glycinendophyticum TaxID=2589807 RepID=A0A504UNP4_9HYPH|nr:AAA family ATPase [Rhizobium glycinendophyticum]TPP06962.1 AAA family ATPase [Rhizobium glycinendophyticum]
MSDKHGYQVDEFIDALRAVADAKRELNRVIQEAPQRLYGGRGRELLDKSPREFLGYCALVRILKRQYGFLSKGGGVLVVRVPSRWPIEDFEPLADLCLGPGKNRDTLDFSVCCHTSRNRKGKWDFQPQRYLSAPRTIVFISKGNELHAEFEAVVDWTADLDVLDSRCVEGLCKFLGSGRLSDDDREFLQQQDVGVIDSAFRRGKPAERAIGRLRKLVSHGADKPTLPLSSFGSAGEWGQRLKRDLALWREGVLPWNQIDKGILLYGPPGTGKTTFAKSLAVECNAHFIASSLGQWQSSGHMGDLLKAMYATFAEAKASAPSILLVDEFDSFGHRAKLSGDNAQYMLEVINAMLEAVDGATGRDGVIIVAASNLPERIDPAFLRPGRLEKHIELSKPDTAGREAILTHYLPEFSGNEALKEAARNLNGKSGADLEYIARQVRKRARDESRPARIADLVEVVPVFIPLKPDELWRICLHEAGHAVLAKVFDIGTITSVEVYTDDNRADQDDDIHGRTMILTPRSTLHTESSYRAEIAMKLAGLAAEEVFVGDRSTASGGLEKGDLAEATELALKMVTMFGMGSTLNVLPTRFLDTKDAALFQKYPYIQREVDEILQSELDEARETLRKYKDVVVSLAKALKKKRSVFGYDLDTILRPLPRRTRRAVFTRDQDLNSVVVTP